MTTHRVEYLITVDQKEPFCNSIPSFNNLLRTIDHLKIQNGYIEAQLVRAQYEVQMGEIIIDKHRYFHIKLSITKDIAVDDFEALLKSIRTVLSKASGKPVQILWDDTSLYYAKQAYPLIYELENIMRKLITKFMITKVGIAWTEEATPKEVLESIRIKGGKSTSNYLYETDFIQLSNFLFKEYSTTPVKEFVEKIRKSSNVSIEDIQVIIPKSNWERYFSSLVNCESEYLRIRWERLYERRNQVAHNRSLSKSEYDEIIRLIQEVRPKLQDAISKLDQILVPEEDRDAIAENAAESSNALVGEFLREWKQFTNELYEIAKTFIPQKELAELEKIRHNTRLLMNAIGRNTYFITLDTRRIITELIYLRNVIVHSSEVEVSEEKVADGIKQISLVRQDVYDFIGDKSGAFNLEVENKQEQRPEEQ